MKTYKELHIQLKKKIQKDYGKKCKDFEISCAVCQAYLMLNLLEDVFELEEKT